MELKKNYKNFTQDKTKILYVFAGLIGLALAMVAAQTLFQQPDHIDENLNQEVEVNLIVEDQELTFNDTLSVQENSTAFEVLNQTHHVGYEETELGYFIQSINQVEGEDHENWMFFINSEFAEVGAGQYEVQENDTIRFSLMSEEESSQYLE